MSTNCPECGTAMEFDVREVRLRTGTCPSCAKQLAVVVGENVASSLGAIPGASASMEGEESGEASPVAGGPECKECGSPLSIREGRGGALELSCDECETTTVFVPQSDVRNRAGARGRPEREGRPRGFAADAPRGRPCRQCGSPIQFTTREDGVLVGECSSCGNRFTLPPRREEGGGGRRFDSGPRDDRPGFRRGPSNRGGRGFRGPPRTSSAGYEDRSRRKRRRPSFDE